MKTSIIRVATTSALFLVLLFIISSCTENWNQFRGPEANMMVTSNNLPEEWGDDLNIRWTADIKGDGWASPVVWGNKAFVVSAFPEKVTPPPDRNASPEEPVDDKPYLKDVYRWEVTCLDVETGEEIWSKVAYKGNPRIKKHRATSYAPETPVTDGKRLYVYFGMTGLFCYDMEGNLLWDKDLGAYETLNGWGTGSSPVLYKNMLYVQVDNEEQSFLVALEASTGDQIWRVNRDENTNYSTPWIWKNRVRTELITGGKKVRSYDPATGDLFWELSAAGYYVIPSAIGDKDRLFIGNAAHRNTPGTLFAVKAGAEGDISLADGELKSDAVLWTNLDAPTENPSPLLHEGLLYFISDRGGLVSVIDASNGDLVYEEKIENVGSCWASPWIYDSKVYFYDEKGVTSVINTGREFELLHQNTLDDQFWASVAVAGDAYLFKGTEKLYCISAQ